MYRLNPAAVYTFPNLLEDDLCATRIERILRACDRSPADLRMIDPCCSRVAPCHVWAFPTNFRP